MAKSIILSTEQVKAFKSGKLTAFVVPMKHQPEWDGANNRWLFRAHPRHEADFAYCTNPENSSLLAETCPFQPGQTVAIREAWNMVREWDGTPTGEIGYKADEDNIVCFDSETEEEIPFTWESPATMPLTAARYNPMVVDCKAVRVGDITQEDAKSFGVYPCPHRPSSSGCKQHADNSLIRDCYLCSYKASHCAKYQKPWNESEWVWLVRIKPIENENIS